MNAVRLKQAGRALTIVILIIGMAFVWHHRHGLDPMAISGAIAVRPAAPLVFLAAHVAASLLFIPRTMLGIAAGLMFGMNWGLVWATAGSVIGAVAGFLIARYVNDGMIAPESMPKIGPVLQRAEAGGWRSVAALRLVPVLPHSLANYALGLTRLPVGSYALGSLLGQLPMTVAYVDLGAAGGQLWGGHADWIAPTVIGVAALALSLLLPRFARARL